MKTVLITGSQGFIGSYLCDELLRNGYQVIGIDNYSKYGKIARPHDNHENFCFYEEDVIGLEKRDVERFSQVDYIIAGAAMIGGILGGSKSSCVTLVAATFGPLSLNSCL